MKIEGLLPSSSPTASGLRAGAGMEDERWRDVKHGALLNAAIAVLMRGWC